MSDKKDSKFSAGLLIGAVLGGAAALFLSPKSGKENRKLVAKKIKELQETLNDTELQKTVKEIFGDVTDEGKKMYKEARKDLAKRLEGIQDKLEDFDHEKYTAMVGDVVEDVKGQVKGSSKHIDSLKKYLLDNWQKLTTYPEEEAQPEKKKSRKKN